MYKLTDTDVVVRIEDGARIPADLSNVDRIAYEQWVENGGMPEPADTFPPLVPQEVSRFQGRAALIQAGHMAAIQAFIDQPDTDIMVKEAWANVTVFRRQSPMMTTVATVLGLTEQDLDNLFIAAHAIGDV